MRYSGGGCGPTCVGFSAIRTRMTAARANMVCAQRPVPKARGCRSIEQPCSNVARACGPTRDSIVRLADTSTTAPGAPSKAAARAASSDGAGPRAGAGAGRSAEPGAAMTSHSSGPSHRTWWAPSGVETAVFGSVGGATPITAASRAMSVPSPGSARRSNWARNGISATPSGSSTPSSGERAGKPSGVERAGRPSIVNGRPLRRIRRHAVCSRDRTGRTARCPPPWRSRRASARGRARPSDRARP